MASRDFKFDQTTVDERPIESACIGTSAGGLTSDDIGRLVKMGTAQNYDLQGAAERIEGGVINSIDTGTFNGGYCFGGVRFPKRIWVSVANAAAVGNKVLAAAQPAANAVMKGAVQVDNTNGNWRIVRKEANDSAGTGLAKCLIEKVP